MKVSRTGVDKATAVVDRLDIDHVDGASLRGDGRPLMRHSDGAMHAAVIDTAEGNRRMSLVGFKDPKEGWKILAHRIGSAEEVEESEPATDSNQNGAYIAYVETGKSGSGGIVHIPDVFDDPNSFRVHGPLTPADRAVRGSCLQASRGYNSVVYGWRDDEGGVYVGVSRDGQSFPEATLLVRDPNVINGPATGIYGDHVIVSFVTSDPRFRPRGKQDGGSDEYYYAWCESGDGGETWSEPAPLIRSIDDLPFAVAHSVVGSDLVRHEVRLSGATSKLGSLQVPTWPLSPVDSRVFAELAITPVDDLYGENWGAADNHVGILAWKPIELGDTWRYILTNRSLFRENEGAKSFDGRTGGQYKYCALPGTSVRVVAYVDKVPRDGHDSDLEDHVVLLMSTNMGDSFDHETSFSASALGLAADADAVIANSLCCHVDDKGDIWQDLLLGDVRAPESILTATLPTGINVAGFDPTMHW